MELCRKEVGMSVLPPAILNTSDLHSHVAPLFVPGLYLVLPGFEFVEDESEGLVGLLECKEPENHMERE